MTRLWGKHLELAWLASWEWSQPKKQFWECQLKKLKKLQLTLLVDHHCQRCTAQKLAN